MQRFHRLLVAVTIISVCVQPLTAATPLKQSTAITIPVGPFVLATDGSAVTSQTVASITSRIYKGPSPTPATLTLSASGGNNDLVVDSTTGQWTLELTSGNTDTLGPLRVSFANGTTFVPFHEDFEVLPANVYESLYGSDKLEVDTVSLAGTAQTGRDIGASVLLSPGTGTGQISLSSGAVTVGTLPNIPNNWITPAGVANDAFGATEVSTAAARKIGRYAGALDSGTVTVTNQTTFSVSLSAFLEPNADNAPAGYAAVFFKASDPVVSERTVVSYTVATGVLVIDSAPDFEISNGDTVEIYRAHSRLKKAGSAGGLATVDGNNRIAGIQGTLNTLDALDTAQDSQHSTTQSALATANGILANIFTAFEADGEVYKLTENALEEVVTGSLSTEDKEGIAALVAAEVGEAVAEGVWNYLAADADTANSMGMFVKGLFTNASWDAFVTDAPTAEEAVQAGMEAQGYTAARAAKMDNADVATSSRLATGGYTAPPSAATNAAAVRTELTTELGRLDAAISSRQTSIWANSSSTVDLSNTKVGTATALGATPQGTLSKLEAAFAAEGVFSSASLANAPTGSGEGGGLTPEQSDWLEATHERVILGVPAAAPGSGAGAALFSNLSGLALDLSPLQLVVDAIKLKTDNLPDDPAEQSSLAELIEGINITPTSEQIDTLIAQLIQGGVGVNVVPVNQVPVPQTRTWILKTSGAGLVGELPIVVKKGGPAVLFAVDYRNVLANNGRIVDLESVAVISGGGGITLGADLEDVDDYGVDRAQAKLRINAVSAGKYVLRIVPRYSADDGGGGEPADVMLVVTD